MKWFFTLLTYSCFTFLNADSTTFSKDRLESFYDQFTCEEKNVLFSAELTSACSIDPNPPSKPIPPAPVNGYFTLVISNQTGQPDSQVYFLGLPNSNTQFFTLSGAPFPGAMSTVPITPTTFSASNLYSYPLTSLPRSTTGLHDYLIYVPYGNSDRMYFSIGNPLYFNSISGSASISIGNVFSDPNYNVLYDFAEVTFQSAVPSCSTCINWTATIDTTQVESFALPIKLGFYSYNPASPSTVTPFIGTVGQPATNPVGFEVGRDTLITTLVTGLTTSSADNTWKNLALPFYTNPYSPSVPTTYLRVMSPKHGGPLLQPILNYQLPIFPSTYLTNNGNGVDYLTTLFTFYSGLTHLFMQPNTGGGSGQIYEGVASAGNFIFGSTTVPANVVTLTQANITLEQLFSGTPPMVGSGSTPAADLEVLKGYFSSAFVVGLLGVTGLFDAVAAPLNEANMQAHLPKTSGTASPPYYSNPFPTPATSLPGYDLYAQLLHQNAILPMSPPFTTPFPTLGLCYAYDFDDTLGFSSAITPPSNTLTSANVYCIITLAPVPTIPTGVFDDPSSYNLTFNFPAGTFGYRQGSSGTFTPASTGITISTVTSTSANPFQIQYNGNIYTVFPKYQFLQPVAQFTTAQQTVLNGATFTPNIAAAPTAFTIVLP